MDDFGEIIHGDSITGIGKIPDNHVHLILSDIPYGIGAEDWDVLHDNRNSAYLGSSLGQKRSGSVFKKRGKPINGWSKADREIPKQYYEATVAQGFLRAHGYPAPDDRLELTRALADLVKAIAAASRPAQWSMA